MKKFALAVTLGTLAMLAGGTVASAYTFQNKGIYGNQCHLMDAYGNALGDHWGATVLISPNNNTYAYCPSVYGDGQTGFEDNVFIIGNSASMPTACYIFYSTNGTNGYNVSYGSVSSYGGTDRVTTWGTQGSGTYLFPGSISPAQITIVCPMNLGGALYSGGIETYY